MTDLPDVYDYPMRMIASAVVFNMTSGMCMYGRVCPLCDCFADGDGGAYRDQVARAAARAAIAVWERDS